MSNQASMIGVLIGCLAIVNSTHANIFQNGDFETGDFTGWNVVLTENGATNTQDVVPFDIDGEGTLPESFAPKFEVGLANYQPNAQEGIMLFQSVQVTAGTAYILDLDWAITSTGGNADLGHFEIFINDEDLISDGVGFSWGGGSFYGHLSTAWAANDSGSVDIGVRITRGYTISDSLDIYQYVDNFSITAVPTPGGLALLGFGCMAPRRQRR